MRILLIVALIAAVAAVTIVVCCFSWSRWQVTSEGIALKEGETALESRIITTNFVLNIRVNCYLIRAGNGFILIDTGMPGKRSAIENELESAGCRPGNLKLIVLTHGDTDHCGNAAYFSKKLGAKTAMHYDDAGMVERGDMFWNRRPPNALIRKVCGALLGLSKANRFKPDLYLKDGDVLTGYGLDARVVHLPGHSQGSIGILTADGCLFCGDLLANTGKPGLWSIIDDKAAADASVRRLEGLEVGTVYPGHGESFLMKTCIATYDGRH